MSHTVHTHNNIPAVLWNLYLTISFHVALWVKNPSDPAQQFPCTDLTILIYHNCQDIVLSWDLLFKPDHMHNPTTPCGKYGTGAPIDGYVFTPAYLGVNYTYVHFLMCLLLLSFFVFLFFWPFTYLLKSSINHHSDHELTLRKVYVKTFMLIHMLHGNFTNTKDFTTAQCYDKTCSLISSG